MNDLPTKCHLCDDPALAVFYFSRGCVCDLATIQPLCPSHVAKSRPATGGSMELIKDLTIDGAFSEIWKHSR